MNLARWQRTLWIMFSVQLFAAMGFSIMFPFIPFYVAELGSRTGLSVEFLSGLVFSAQAFTMMLASPIWGALADRYGRKLMVERTTFGGAIILFLMAFVRSGEELVLLRAVQGMITGVVSAASALVAAEAPRERTGYALGVLQVGLWSGLAVGPLIGGFIADTWGFRTTFVVTAILLAIAGVVVWLGIEETFTPTARPTRYLSFVSDWGHVLSAPGVGLAYSIRFLSYLGRHMIIPIAPLFIQSLLSNTAWLSTFTGLVVGVASVFGTASALYLGRMGDRWGHRRILMGSALAAGLFYLPQSLVTSAWQLLVLQALTGAAFGGILPSLSALLAHYTDIGEEGVVYGLENSVTAGARAIAPLAGASVAIWFGLRGTFAVAGLIFFLMGLLAAWRLSDPKPSYQPQTM